MQYPSNNSIFVRTCDLFPLVFVQRETITLQRCPYYLSTANLFWFIVAYFVTIQAVLKLSHLLINFFDDFHLYCVVLNNEETKYENKKTLRTKVSPSINSNNKF